MGSCCNDTSGLKFFFCEQPNIYILIGVIGSVLVISLSCNIYVCVSKFCPGKRGQKPSGSPRHMEDNPIYGNISYTQTEGDQLSSLSVREQQRVSSNSQSKTQDCYANLALKPPRLQSGRSSPQIQYSDVVQLEVPLEAEKQDEGSNDGAAPALSDLYASVPSHRVKVNAADTGEDYANHLCTDSDADLP